MNDLSPKPRQTLAQLNQTPTAETAARLLQGTEIDLEQRLALAGLLEWAVLNQAAEPAWAQAVLQALARAEAEPDPAPLAARLEAPGLAQAQTLDEAGRLMLRWVADLIPPGAQPA